MKLVYSLAAACLLALLTGCSADFAPSPSVAAAPGVALSGKVHGGQQPLTATKIYLYAAGNTGYGSASTSLLRTSATGVLTDSSGLGYVTTDAGGNFTMTGDWSCVNASDQVYMLALGGNPGLAAGTNNPSIALVDVIGTCSTLNAGTFVTINELSTVAAATALAQFTVDATHIGTSATNASGLANAFATALNLVDIASGTARTTNLAGNGTVPQATINTLANIMSVCVNSARSDGGLSNSCGTYFQFAVVSGKTQPTNTFAAALNIATNPNNNTYWLFLQSPASPPFQPVLPAEPLDWTIGISYPINARPNYIAIDGTGNAWISATAAFGVTGSQDSVVKLSPTGALLSGTGFTNLGQIKAPQGIALDDTGSAWIVTTGGSLHRLNADGTNYGGLFFPNVAVGAGAQGIAIDKFQRAWISLQGSNGANNNSLAVVDHVGNNTSFGIPMGGVYGPQGVAIDTAQNVWAAGYGGGNNLGEVGSSFNLESGSNGFTGGGLNAPSGAAIDASGRVWVANSYNYLGLATLSVFSGSGAAVTSAPSSAYSYGWGTNYVGIANIVAIDGANTAWTAVCGASCTGGHNADQVGHFGADGTYLNPHTTTLYTFLNTQTGYSNPTFNGPQAVAIDASGNLWVGNAASTTVTELVGVAAPVKTPIQAALKAANIGTRP